MNFLFVPYLQQIPQWKECYYDYQTLNKITKFIRKCVLVMNKISVALKNHRSKGFKQKLYEVNEQLIIMIQSQRQSFYKYSEQESNIICMFIQLKIYQIREKLDKYQNLLTIMGSRNHQLVLLFQNLYIQIHYLNNATNFNMAQQLKTIDSLNNSLRIFNDLQYQFYGSRTLRRMSLQIQKLLSKIQLEYTINHQQNQPRPQDFQQNMHKTYKKMLFYEPLVVGSIMGGLGAFLGIVIIINIVNHLQLGTNKIFTQQFPVWRGASGLIFYIWVLGLNVLFFQKSSINFKLIFHFQKHNLPHSRYIFLLASTFSFIYLTLFTLFFLELSGTIKTQFNQFGYVFWLIFIGFIFQPFPFFQRQGRFYMLKMIARTLLPCFFQMNFLTIWISQQMVSLSQPITDLFYSVCLLISKDSAATITISQNFNSALVMMLYLYRVMQNSRFWHQISQARADKVYDFWAPAFIGIIRGIFGFLTGLASLLNRLKAFQNVSVFWVIIAVCATLVSWYVDVRGDWGLLQHQSKQVLRKKLLFPRAKYLYYFIGIFDLVLRAGWVLTLSSFQLGSGTGVWPMLFIMIISFIQIIRRGAWNMLRLQFQHVKNCGQFQATIRDGHILKSAEQKAAQIQQKRRQKESQQNNPSIERIQQVDETNKNKRKTSESQNKCRIMRKNNQLEIFKFKLGSRNQLRDKIQRNLKADQYTMRQINRQIQFLKVSTALLETVHLIGDQQKD